MRFLGRSKSCTAVHNFTSIARWRNLLFPEAAIDIHVSAAEAVALLRMLGARATALALLQGVRLCSFRSVSRHTRRERLAVIMAEGATQKVSYCAPVTYVYQHFVCTPFSAECLPLYKQRATNYRLTYTNAYSAEYT